MKLRKTISFGLAALVVITSLPVSPKIVMADNAIVQTHYTADPSPMVVGDTMYLITSHDEDVIENGFYTMKNWNCYSTTDMVNWTDHGTIFGQSSFEWGHITDFRAWAPQCVERNGKYYLYVPILRKGKNDTDGSPGFSIGVAVADNPAGPYTDAIGKPLIEGDWYDIDPTVLVDDDGQAYLYYGQSLKYVKLNEDMISYDTSIGNKGIVKVDMPNYVEGPWITKHDNMYYFMYAGSKDGASEEHKGDETLRYAYSDSLEGPWTDGGILMETTVGNSFTNHPGVADYKGHSYLFYHTNQLKDGGSFHRSVCVSEFKYNGDGSISPVSGDTSKDYVQMVDSIDPIGTLNPYNRVEAETICYADGSETGKLNVKTEMVGTDDVRVTNLNEGDYIKLREVDFGNYGAVKFLANVSAAQDGGSFEIITDDMENGDVIGKIEVPKTGEDIYKSIETAVSKVTGVHDLYFVFHTANADDMIKFDYWQFTQDEIPQTPSPSAVPTVLPSPAPVISTSPQPEIKAPAMAKITKAKAAKKKAVISWKKTVGANGYTVQYSTDKKFRKAIKKFNTKKTTVTIKKLKPRKVYYVRVAAYSVSNSGKKLYGKYSTSVRVKIK